MNSAPLNGVRLNGVRLVLTAATGGGTGDRDFGGRRRRYITGGSLAFLLALLGR